MASRYQMAGWSPKATSQASLGGTTKISSLKEEYHRQGHLQCHLSLWVICRRPFLEPQNILLPQEALSDLYQALSAHSSIHKPLILFLIGKASHKLVQFPRRWHCRCCRWCWGGWSCVFACQRRRRGGCRKSNSGWPLITSTVRDHQHLQRWRGKVFEGECIICLTVCYSQIS